MRIRFISASSFLLAGGLLLPLAAGASAQDPDAQTERSKRISGQVDRLVDSPDENQWRTQVVQLLNRECARVATAESYELDQQALWLNNNLADLRVRLKAARQQVHRSSEDPSTYRATQDRIEELEVELAIAGLMHEEISKCISERRNRLVQMAERRETAEGPRTVRANWKAKCSDTPGIQADTLGALELTFHKGKIAGTVRWTESNVSLDVEGLYFVDGNFRLSLVRPEALGEFRLVGDYTESLSGHLSASGTIRYGNTYKGCNIGPDPTVCEHKLSCEASWRSR